MQTMKPLLRRGRSLWDRVLLPIDEFEERVRSTQKLLEEQQLEAAIIFGGGEQYHNLAYLTNLVPMIRWQAVIIPKSGEPSVIAGIGGSRELPFVRTLTWVSDVRYCSSLGEGIRSILNERSVTSGRLGLAGAEEVLPFTSYDEMGKALESYGTVRFDESLLSLRQQKRAREIRVMQQAVQVLYQAELAGVREYLKGASNAAAVIAAEQAARVSGAHDFRALANVERAEELWPCEGPSTKRNEPLLAYLAVEYDGYWADHALTFPPSMDKLDGAVEAGLASMRASARAGATVSEVARAAISTVGSTYKDMNIEMRYGLGNGIGLALNENPMVRPDSTDILKEGMTISIRLYLSRRGEPGLGSDIVLIGADNGKSLLGRM